jgi:hypothetical protein
MPGGHAGWCAVTCPDHPDWCLQDHIRPRLDGWAESPSTPGQYHARCPAHGGRKRSLSVRVGDRGRRVVWTCHARPPCSDAAVRAALVRLGVDDGCLPPVRDQRTDDALASAIIAALDATRAEPAARRLLAVIVTVCGPAPTTAALAGLAARFGIGRSTAYRVMDTSHAGTNVMDARWIAASQRGTARPRMGQPREGYTSGFGASITPGVDNSVGPEGHPRASVPITRCATCDGEMPAGRRADARYCTEACQQKAYRARRKAGAVPPAQFAASQWEASR